MNCSIAYVSNLEKTSSREGDDNDNLESNTLVSDENGGNLGTPNKGILKSQMEMTVIGGENKKHTVDAVRRTLPKWLANPSYFSSDVNENLLAITEIKGLHANLVKKLEKQGVEHFFPVQKSVIPAVLSSWEKNSPFGRGGFLPQDICVCAPTGSGKTLSYVLPVIELLRQHTLQSLEALVIVPTKDLATQVWNVFNTYVEGTGLSVGLANGIKGLQKEKRQLGSNRYGLN
jgi:ATP-dependent RNA helicase DDX51/DBP6